VKLPIIPTLIVALACAAMVALGAWQLRRADEKNTMVARYATAAQLPEMAFPLMQGGNDPLFRRAGGLCLEPLLPSIEGGKNAKGASGWRHIVVCRTGAEGPGMAVDIGWSKDFKIKPNWKGGDVRGVIAEMPSHASLFSRMLGKAPPPTLVLIAAPPAPGLQPSAPPNLADVPNNHFGYAVQWFIFAGIAALIYGIALRRRRT
jgi:surfeit locus 1 family protein